MGGRMGGVDSWRGGGMVVLGWRFEVNRRMETEGNRKEYMHVRMTRRSISDRSISTHSHRT